MTLDKNTRERLRAHCGQLDDDDGVNPKEFFRGPSRGRKEHRKTRQLCSQVAETLSLMLSGEMNDELLQTLLVESVDPSPNTSQLAVTLRIAPGCGADPQAIHERLTKVAGRLRCEVAAAITRRKAPKLVFHLIASK